MKIKIAGPGQKISMPSISMPIKYIDEQINMSKAYFDEYTAGSIFTQSFEDQHYTVFLHSFSIQKNKTNAQIELDKEAILLLFMWQGSFSIYTSDLQNISLKQGEYNLVALKKGEHSLIAKKGSYELFIILLSPPIIEAFSYIYPELKKTQDSLIKNPSTSDNRSHISSYINHLYNQFKNNNFDFNGWKILRETLILSIIMESLSNIYYNANLLIQSSQENKFTGALKYIDNNLGEKLDLANISEKLNTIPDTLRKGFKRTFGYNLLSYVREKRMQKASNLLKETNLPVQEIAWEVGYESPAGFTRIFSIFHGISPIEYRLKEQKSITHSCK